MQDTLVPVSGGETYIETYKESQNTIPGNHDFRGKFVTEGLFSFRARQTKEDEEYDRSREDD